MNISVTGDKKFQRDIQSLMKRIKNPKDAMLKASNLMFQDVQDHFKNEMGPSGRWQALSSSYEERKRRKNIRGGILVWSGRMKKVSFSHDNKNAYVGTNVRVKGYSYPSAHQMGKGVPKRQFLWLSKRAGNKILDMMVRYIDKS